jgi:hypothetical protein
MEFIEVESVAVLVESLGAEREFSDLQCALIANQELGDVIQGTGGLRKIRMAVPNRGKRGGVRIIYMIVSVGELICFLDAYTKNEKETLTAEDAKKLSRLAELIRKEYGNEKRK